MQGDVFGVVVPRNTPIPTNKSRTFTTVEDNQTTVTFPVYEGERVTCKENRLLGEFEVRLHFIARLLARRLTPSS
jgi:heat shock protein 1/8